MLMTDLKEAFFSLIFPNLCINCSVGLQSGERHVCTRCLLKLPYYEHDSLEDRFLHLTKVTFVDAYLLYVKNGMVQKMIYDIKYRGNDALANTLGVSYAEQLLSKRDFKNFDYLLPVPLHPKKLKKRGFNQSEKIASGIAEVLDLPVVTDLVRRVEYSKSQTHKDRLGRLLSLVSAFEIVADKETCIKGKNILLVDDVITTGTTSAEVIALLEKKGVASNGILSLSASPKT